MPTYEYACDACQHAFEEFQSITAAPLKKCPSCGKAKLKRLIGTGGGLIFKGSGFYITDYRSDNYKKSAEAAKSSESGKPAETTKTADSGASNTSSKGDTKSKSESAKPTSDAAPKSEKPATPTASTSKSADRSGQPKSKSK